MTGEQSPQVSVVIPTHDRWALLSAHALPSALGQVDVDVEVVVVDDGSTDETFARLRELDDPRLRVHRHDTPRGVSAARNTGIAAARGTWVAFLDDDDLWSPHKLACQLGAAACAHADWAYSGSLVVGDGLAPLYAHPLPDASSLLAALEHGNVVPAGSSNVVVRSDVLREVGLFDETIGQGEDWDLWLRLARRSRPAVCGDVLVATLSHPNRSLFVARDALDDMFRVIAKHRPLTRADRLAATQWLAGQHHRAGNRFRASGAYLRAAVLYRSPGNVLAALGALGGERGLGLASAVLRRTRGVSHLDEQRLPVTDEPDWLARYRTR